MSEDRQQCGGPDTQPGERTLAFKKGLCYSQRPIRACLGESERSAICAVTSIFAAERLVTVKRFSVLQAGQPVTRVSHRATKQGGFVTTGLEDRERLFRCFRVHGGWVFPEEQPAAFLFVANASSCNISDKYRAFSCQDGLHVVKAIISVSVNTGSRLSESISKASPASPGRCKMSSSTRRMGIWLTGPP